MTKEADEMAVKKALDAGCYPFWFDGILGPAWHCGCPRDKETHYIDSQCSVLKFYTAGGP